MTQTYRRTAQRNCGLNLQALLNDTAAASVTEDTPPTSAFSRGLRAGLEQTTPKPVRPAQENPFARYRDNPVGFAEDVLGLKVWEKMRAILEAVAGHRKVAVRSGHKVSKSTT